MTYFTRSAAIAILLVANAGCSDDSSFDSRVPLDGAPLATAASSLPSGSLNLCKIAGTGIAAGETFVFRATLLGVARTLNVAAGACVVLDVPRETAPLGKGYFTNHSDPVLRLLPGAGTLGVDGVNLSAAEVLNILAPAPTVSAGSALLLNLAQQLISADLNILRGVQPSPSALQAIADGNARLAITRGQGQLQLTTAATNAQLSAIVDALDAFNEAKKVTATPPSATLQLAERVPTLVDVTAITCDPTARCSAIQPAQGTVSVTVTSGEITTTRYTNAGNRVLRFCKIAGAGVANGASFTYGIKTGPSTLFTAIAAGTCDDVPLAEGSYTVSEPFFSPFNPNTAVSNITCDPVERCSDLNVAAGKVEVQIGGSGTVVSFTNESTLGTVRICKTSGAGITDGTSFTFGIGVGGSTDFYGIDAGSCSDFQRPEGSYIVSESAGSSGQPPSRVTGISCEPAARCSNTSLDLQRTTAAIVRSATTVVTFTNVSTLGTIRICKTSGAGITDGTSFTFGIGVAGGSTDFYGIDAGSCVDFRRPEGSYIVSEPAGFSGQPASNVSSISCEPAASCSSTSNELRRTTVAVAGASTTTVVTFTNVSAIGTLRICKTAGVGITIGTQFRFGIGVAGGSTDFVGVNAGSCEDFPRLEGSYIVSEPAGFTGQPASTVASITCVPVASCSSTSLELRRTTVAMVGATTTVVTFTNDAAPDDFSEVRALREFAPFGRSRH